MFAGDRLVEACNTTHEQGLCPVGGVCGSVDEDDRDGPPGRQDGPPHVQTRNLAAKAEVDDDTGRLAFVQGPQEEVRRCEHAHRVSVRRQNPPQASEYGHVVVDMSTTSTGIDMG